MKSLEKHYDRIAAVYEFLDWGMERFRYRYLRPIVWREVRGKTLDLGVGTGLNMPFYPKETHVTGVDLCEGMLRRARARCLRLKREVELHQMDATELKFEDNTFDSVVSTFLFCVLPDQVQPKALSEVNRILTPGGRLVLMEYTYSQRLWRRLWMKLLSPWVRWTYRAGFDRHTIDYIKNGEWKIIRDEFIHHDVIRLIVAEKI
jgi:phosphatidylethanolamine/phosphatidyl-N-methylethanolamine N-methyltransferase